MDIAYITKLPSDQVEQLARISGGFHNDYTLTILNPSQVIRNLAEQRHPGMPFQPVEVLLIRICEAAIAEQASHIIIKEK